MTVPLGIKASLITVTIPLFMKYPSVSLAASWTLSLLIIWELETNHRLDLKYLVTCHMNENNVWQHSMKRKHGYI